MSKTIYNTERVSFQTKVQSFSVDDQLRFRPIQIVGLIKKPANYSKVNAVHPMSLRGSGGNIVDALRPLNTDRGHLIASSFGGPNLPENIVPMYASLNQIGWSNMEKDIRTVYLNKYENLFMSVDIRYRDHDENFDQRVPSRFDVELFTKERGVKVSLKSYPFEHKKPTVSYQGSFDRCDLELLEKNQFHLDMHSAWQIEDKIRNLNVPALHSERPYEVIDFMMQESDLFAKVKIGNGKSFTAYQRDLILNVNRLENCGSLISDAADDDFKELLDVPGDQGAQIHHIFPVSLGGSNAFSNAMVVSAAFNRSNSNFESHPNLAPNLSSAYPEFDNVDKIQVLLDKKGRIVTNLVKGGYEKEEI